VAGEPLGDVLRLLGRDAGLQNYLAQTDAQLLEHFTRRRDEPAFAALMVRHGPMVYGVCRRMLRDAQEAEDAFQASFLVLARKAGGIRRRLLLGAWLYGVACRIAARLRGQSARRRQREEPGVDVDALPADDPAWSDVGPVVHEEVQRLPSHYRDAVVLCFLEGKSNEEAAQLLHRPVGTIKSRLTRARELLRSRLARCGLGVASAVALTTALAATAQASAALTAATVQAAAQFTGGAAAPAATRAVVLAREILRTVLWTKVKLAAVAVVVVAALVPGGLWITNHALRPATPAAGAAAPQVADDREAIQGDWRVVRVEYEGHNMTDDAAFRGIKGATWRFTADRILVKAEGWPDSDYTLDPTTRPKHLDLGHKADAGFKVTIKAIYALDGDDLMVHLPSGERPERPKVFVTEEGVVTLLVKFHRET